MASDGVEAVSAAPSEVHSSQSPKHCKGCGNPVKDHVGPHGKDRCIAGIGNGLRERLEQLERVVAANCEWHAEDLSRLEAQHAQELARPDDLHQERLNGLLEVIGSLQVSSTPRVEQNRSTDSSDPCTPCMP